MSKDFRHQILTLYLYIYNIQKYVKRKLIRPRPVRITRSVTGML